MLMNVPAMAVIYVLSCITATVAILVVLALIPVFIQTKDITPYRPTPRALLSSSFSTITLYTSSSLCPDICYKSQPYH